MRHNQIIKLVAVSITADAIGNQVESLSEREVFANEYSVSSSEFYNAAAAGIRASKAFEIYAAEYQAEDRFKVGTVTYRIVRTQGKGEKLILVGERVAADG